MTGVCLWASVHTLKCVFTLCVHATDCCTARLNAHAQRPTREKDNWKEMKRQRKTQIKVKKNKTMKGQQEGREQEREGKKEAKEEVRKSNKAD